MKKLKKLCLLFPFMAFFLTGGAFAQISWQKMSGPNDGVGTIVAASNNDVYLGTNLYGVHKSTDNGSTWVAINTNIPDTTIRHLAMTTNGILLAGTASRGIYKYVNGSWTSANNGLPSNNLLTVALVSGPNGVAYMVVGGDGTYKWNGASWSSIKYNLPSNIKALSVSSNGTLYAGCFQAGIYQFNGSNNWTVLGSIPPNVYVSKMVLSANDTFYVAGHLNSMYRIPVATGVWTSINAGLPVLSANTLGIDGNNNLLYGVSDAGFGKIYKYSSGSNSWSMVSSALTTSGFNSYCAAPNGHVYIGGSGIYKSTTGGDSWQDINAGLDARKTIACFKAACDGTLFVGTSFSGVWRSIDHGATWQQKNTGLGGVNSLELFIDAAGDIFYDAFVPGANMKGKIFRSTDNGDSWTMVAMNGTDLYTELDQHLNDTVWATGRFGGAVLSYSTQNGAPNTWVNHPINGFSAIWDIAFGNNSKIFLASETEGVTRSTNGGLTWTYGVGNSIPWYGNVRLLDFDAAGYLFAVTDWYNHAIFFSEPGDDGNNWIEMTDTDLDGMNGINDIIFDNNNNVYIATSNNVSKDAVYMANASNWSANTDWVSNSNGLPASTQAQHLEFDPSGYLYTVFYTTKGGLYRSATPVNAVPTPTVSIAVTSGSNPTCTGNSVTFAATAGNAGASPIYVWKENGSIVGSNSNTYSSSTLSNGATVTCTVTSNIACTAQASTESNPIVMTVNPVFTPSVSIAITSGSSTICAGSPVTFSATPANGGNAPSYVWKENGSIVGSNSNTYASSNLADGTSVTCTLANSETCASPSSAESNPMVMTVNPLPASPTVSASGPLTFCPGSSLTLTSSAASSYVWSNGATTASIVVSTADNFTVTITDANGCTAPSGATTTALYAPATVPTILRGGSNLYTYAANSYQWYLNGVAINGATLQFVHLTVAGTYTVVTTNANGCKATSAGYIYNLLTSAADPASNNVAIVPNPNNGRFRVMLPEGSTGTLCVYNTLGQRLYESTDLSQEIDLSVQVSGNYFVEIRTADQSYRKRLVIQR